MDNMGEHSVDLQFAPCRAAWRPSVDAATRQIK